MNSQEKLEKLENNIETVFVGKNETVRMALVGLLANGHILIEDVPGVGKTILARALAKSISCTFRRIQFTPDLLPSDILGVSVYDTSDGNFVFKPGPIFSNVVLADEINRTTPRTQSSLLEAMNDFQVSIDGSTRVLERPFTVFATQNPFEFEGTYPLPESQLDRFLMRIDVGYPDQESERQILASQRLSHPLDSLEPVLTAAEVVQLQEETKQVKVDESLVSYLLEIVRKTRDIERLDAGVSPRGSLFLCRAAQALAHIEGRRYCTPDDIKRLAVPVLSHRLIHRARRGAPAFESSVELVEDVLRSTPVPL